MNSRPPPQPAQKKRKSDKVLAGNLSCRLNGNCEVASARRFDELACRIRSKTLDKALLKVDFHHATVTPALFFPTSPHAASGFA